MDCHCTGTTVFPLHDPLENPENLFFKQSGASPPAIQAGHAAGLPSGFYLSTPGKFAGIAFCHSNFGALCALG